MKKIIILIALLTMTGCSTKFAYRNADWLIHWYLDDYIELTDEQEQQFDIHFQQWLEWHKTQELGNYISHLNELKADIQSNDITLDRVAYHRQKAFTHWLRFRDKIAPDLAAMAPMLEAKQVDELFESLKEQEDERAEQRAKLTPEKKQQRWVKRNKKQLKRWLGRLTDEQEAMVEAQYSKLQSTADLWYEYRLTYQDQLLSLFATQSRGIEFERQLLALLSEPEKFRSEELNQRNEHNATMDYQLTVALFNSLTNKQRRHLLEELDDLIADLTSLQN